MSPRPTLAALLRRRPRDEVAAFVAALYAARGAETAVEDGVAIVDGDRCVVVSDSQARRLRARWHPLPSVDVDGADRLVIVADVEADAVADDGTPGLTPADLDDLARYGLDRTSADAVLGDHLGVGVDDLAPPTRSRPAAGGREASVGDSDVRRRPREGRDDADGSVPNPVVAVAVVAIVLVAVLLSTSGSVGLDLTALGGTTTGVPTPAGDTAEPEGDGATETPTSTASDGPASDRTIVLAPGLTTRGVTDAEALADAHATVLANRSYTWTLTHVELVDGAETGRAVEVVTVAAPSVYVSDVGSEGVITSRGPVAERSSYADGELRYRPTSGGIEREAIGDEGDAKGDGDLGRQESRARRYYGALLDGEETSVVRTVLGDPRLYVVDVDGSGSPLVRNYTATAHVTPDGVVRYYSGSYCLVRLESDTERSCFSLTMQYRAVDETAVRPPAWYTERNATA